MKDFLIGMGIGFVVGAVMVKSNKDLSKTIDKSKQMVDDKVEIVKDVIAENKPKKPTSQAKKQS